MNSSSSGRRLEGFLSGKGFYIVLFLCAAVIGASAWMTVGRNETMSDDALQTSADNERTRDRFRSRPGTAGSKIPALSSNFRICS